MKDRDNGRKTLQDGVIIGKEGSPNGCVTILTDLSSEKAAPVPINVEDGVFLRMREVLGKKIYYQKNMDRKHLFLEFFRLERMANMEI